MATKKKTSKSKSGKAKTTTSTSKDTGTEKQQLDFRDVFFALLDSFKEDATEKQKKHRDNILKEYLSQEHSSLTKKYNIIVLHDGTTMVRSDIDKIYRAVANFEKKKPILLVLFSDGGSVGPAYLIGKLCREYSDGDFSVVVPRRAKSAATLLCCAANEIHMGSLSELGPIDPQLNGMPVLGLKNAVKHIAELVEEKPETSEMFARYLNLSLKPIDLGCYERSAESALQYAERLLDTHSQNLKYSPSKIANRLVYTYKDHGFVIDKAEACEIFGDNVIKVNTEEYNYGNSLYGTLSFIEDVSNSYHHSFYFIGGLDSDPTFRKRSQS